MDRSAHEQIPADLASNGRELIGKTVAEALPEVADQGFVDLLDTVFRTGEPFVGRRTPIDLQTGTEALERFYLDFIYQAIKEPDGSISGIFVEGQDVTDHVATEDRLALINGELQHRVKNTLAMVQAIAMQSLQPVEDREPVDTFLRRLMALARAHDTLVQQNWSAARMHAAVTASIDSFDMADRFDVSGSELHLGPSATLSLSMILHELTTNAIKYGSLSVETGKVELSWSEDRSRGNLDLVISWKERGGPAAVAPTRKGFGTKLIRMGLDGTGGVETHYEPEGFSAEIRAPLDQLQRK